MNTEQVPGYEIVKEAIKEIDSINFFFQEIAKLVELIFHVIFLMI
jgi:hypothetical protein